MAMCDPTDPTGMISSIPVENSFLLHFYARSATGDTVDASSQNVFRCVQSC